MTRTARSHTSPLSSGHASMKPSVSGGIPESAPERSTTRSQWSQVPRTAPKRGGAPAVENRMSLMPRPAPNGRRANVSRPRPPCSHHTSCRWRLPAFARGLHPLDVLGPAEDVIRIAVRETLVRDSHALEVRVEHHREPRLHLPARRERALGGIPLGTVRRGAGVERERAFLDDAFAGAIEGVAEEHQFVRIDVEVRVRSRDLARMPSRHDGDKRAEGEAAVRNVAGLERLMHRWGRVDLAGDAVVALDVEDERVQGAFPSDEIERVVAQGDAGDLPTSVTKYTSCRSPFRKNVSTGMDSVGFETEIDVRGPWTIGFREERASPSNGIRAVKMWYGWRMSASGGNSGTRSNFPFFGGFTCSVG